MVTLSYLIKIPTRKSVVFINLVLGYPVVFAILGEDFNLVGDAVAVPLVFVVTGEADIERINFLVVSYYRDFA